MGLLNRLIGGSTAAGEVIDAAGGAVERAANAIRGVDPELERQLAQAQADLAMSHVELAKQQASHASFFVAGARPALLWVGVLALALHYIVGPVAIWLGGSGPQIDVAGLWPIISGTLGIGLLRTVEKSQGTQGRH
jgi:hypothetical protein